MPYPYTQPVAGSVQRDSHKEPHAPRMRALILSSRLSAVVLAIVGLSLTGCASKPKSPEPAASVSNQQPTAAPTSAALETDAAETGPQTASLKLPKNFGRFTGDWDGIVKRGALRVLVVYNKTGFFYDHGGAHGAAVEAMEEFANVTNTKLKTGAKKFKVVYLPVPPGQLQAALNDGIGDIACTAILITPEREQLFDFTVPVRDDVKLVVVTSKASPSLASVEELSGKDIYVGPVTVARAELDKLNQRFKQAGKPEIGIKLVDQNLTEEDLLEMVNAGLIPATVSMDFRAELWSKVFSNMVVTPAVLKEEGQVGWAMRKGSPQLKAVVDDFIKNHGKGTAFGNTMVQRYLKSTKWIKNSTSGGEMKKFEAYVKYLQAIRRRIQLRLRDARCPGLPGIEPESGPHQPPRSGRRHAGSAPIRRRQTDKHPRCPQPAGQYSRRRQDARPDHQDLLQ